MIREMLVKMSPCPFCGAPLDSATGTNESMQDAPKPGDMTLCIECANLSFYDDDMNLRKPTDEEERSVAENTELTDYLEYLRDALEQIKLQNMLENMDDVDASVFEEE